MNKDMKLTEEKIERAMEEVNISILQLIKQLVNLNDVERSFLNEMIDDRLQTLLKVEE